MFRLFSNNSLNLFIRRVFIAALQRFANENFKELESTQLFNDIVFSICKVLKPKPIKDKRGIGIAIRGIGKAFKKGN